MCVLSERAWCAEVRLTLSHDALHQEARGREGSRGDGMLNGTRTHTHTHTLQSHYSHIQEPPVPIVQKLTSRWAYTGSSQLWLLPVC